MQSESFLVKKWHSLNFVKDITFQRGNVNWLVQSIVKIEILQAMLLKIFKFFNNTLLRRSMESTQNSVVTLSILKANLVQSLRHKLGFPLRLRYPNDTIKFPLPNQWTSEKQYSRQSLSLVVKQIGVTSRDSGHAENSLINKQKNRSLSNIYHMNLTNSAHHRDLDQLQHIINGYGPLCDTFYNKTREELFGESLVNGEHSYMLRAYNNQTYDLMTQSRQIDQAYKKSLSESIRNERFNEENLKAAGFTKEEIQQSIGSGKDLYSMLFEDLQTITNGDTLIHKPTIIMDNTEIKDTFFFQTPYPVLMKNKNNRFVCIAIGFRYKIKEGQNFVQKVKFYSPFFDCQPEKIWRLAQSQLSQTIFTDFNIRFHLGLLHFSTNQYLVPLSNFQNKICSQTFKSNYLHFTKYCVDIFSKGLDGVNVTATASLVHPIEDYSIINRVFNLNQQNAVNLIAAYSNRVDFTKLSPKELLCHNGISTDVANKDLIRAKLDLQFYEIISSYIDAVYDIFQIEKLSRDIMLCVNNEIPNMSVGGLKNRPLLGKPQDVKTLIKNLAFCWVGYHSHTFAGISYYTYYSFRPTMLKRAVPYNESEWQGYHAGSELPPTKVMMEAGKLTQGTTQMDAENYILDVMREQQFRLNQQIIFKIGDDLRHYQALKKATSDTVAALIKYRDHVIEVNATRKDVLFFNYLNPEYRQASLNI